MIWVMGTVPIRGSGDAVLDNWGLGLGDWGAGYWVLSSGC